MSTRPILGRDLRPITKIETASVRAVRSMHSPMREAARLRCVGPDQGCVVVSSGPQRRSPRAQEPEHRGLLLDLEPEVGRLLDRHVQVAQEWFPHEYIPYRLGPGLRGDPGRPTSRGLRRRPHRVRGQPPHGGQPAQLPPRDPRHVRWRRRRLDHWIGRWTAEEGRHAIVLRDYLTVTRNIDPVALERGRMRQLEKGYDREAVDPLARPGLRRLPGGRDPGRPSHTGRFSKDPVADRIMLRISADENLHALFYRDILRAALHREPSAAVKADRRRGARVRHAGHRNPGLPAQGRPDGSGRNLRPAHPPRRGALPLLRHWRVFERGVWTTCGGGARATGAYLADSMRRPGGSRSADGRPRRCTLARASPATARVSARATDPAWRVHLPVGASRNLVDRPSGG